MFASVLKAEGPFDVTKYSPDQPRDGNGRFADASEGKEPVAQNLRRGYDQNSTEDQVLHGFHHQVQQMVARTKDRIAEAVQAGQATSKLYATKNSRGLNVYTDERKALHQQILKDLFSPAAVAAAKPAAGEPPTAYFLGGRGGSGKSQFDKSKYPASGVYDPAKVIVLDPDALKEKLGDRAQGGDGGYHGWNAFLYHDESGDLMNQALAMARKLKVNVVLDQTMRSDPKAKIKSFKDKGFRTEGHYMFLPEQMAAQRAVGRFQGEDGKFRGRFVPPSVVLGNKANEEMFDKNIPRFDTWSVWRNDVPKGQQARRVAHGGKNEQGT